jgi:hypothetical protein
MLAVGYIRHPKKSYDLSADETRWPRFELPPTSDFRSGSILLQKSFLEVGLKFSAA